MIPTKTYRAASMRQDVDIPRHGSRGIAWRVPGAPDSSAFLFQPDGDTNAYYCEESDLDFEECPCLSGQPALCPEHQQSAWDGFISRHGFPDSLRG